MVRLECAPNMLPPTSQQFTVLQKKYRRVYCALCAENSAEESKLLESFDEWIHHWREEHNMSR